MNTIRYYCNHCNHTFEAEQKDNLECPSCFWTSSVIPEAEHREREASSRDAHVKQRGAGVSTGFKMALDALKPLFMILAAVGLIAGGVIYFKPQTRNALESLAEHASKMNPFGQENTAPLASGKKQEQSIKGQALVKADPSLDLNSEPTISEKENEILARRIELDAASPLSALEKEILSRQAVLKTGRIEKLPGPVWNLEQFNKLLADQQAAYQVPLPRSYRNKLEQLFESKYAAGGQSFTDGRILEARNLWVESLGFPIFANDIEKHRGVVLTMLRPFINDTLSKIGALNGMLVEGPVRDRETRLNQSYEQFLALVSSQRWEEAYHAGQNLLKLTADFDKTAVSTPQVPPYPPSAALDRDIAKTLYDLLETSRPATADVGSLEQDVRMKLQVVETLLPGLFADAVEHYKAGLKAMDSIQWQKAIDAFLEVQEPAILKRDSAEKIKILKKLVRSELETGAVSG